MNVDGPWRRLLVPVVILVALSAGGLAMCGLPGDSLEDGAGIAGTYVVNGVDPNDVEYSGTVTITPAATVDEYDVQWIVTGTIQSGVGVLTGDRLTVEWETVTSARGISSGTAEYVVGDDGVLRGTRSVDGVDEPGTEEIFPDT
ncbi:hypothetical protein [Ilumatobacter sp.]|uniref:hypothetical protein n=1 Tax=Ilumatobacter sp. TaxID=1967498 RepID=UPI003AF5CC55